MYRLLSIRTRIPSWPATERLKGPPPPKLRFMVQRTEKLLFGSAMPAGWPLPQFFLIEVSQSDFFGVPLNFLLA